MIVLKFEYGHFSCDVDVFRNGKDILVRFYDKLREQNENQIINLVIVDSGYGFLCLKVKGDSGLLSGYLDKNIFSSEEMVCSAIDFLEGLSPETKGVYIPYHVECVKLVDYVEYNGEY